MNNRNHTGRYKQEKKWVMLIGVCAAVGFLVWGMAATEKTAKAEVQSKCRKAEIVLQGEGALEISFFEGDQRSPYQKVRCTKETPHRILGKSNFNEQGSVAENQAPSNEQEQDYDWIQAERPAQVIWKSAEGTIQQCELYTYHPSGQPLQCIITDPQGNEQTQSWAYDEQDRMIGKTELVEGRVQETTYEYEEETGRLCAAEVCTEKGKTLLRYDDNERVCQEREYTQEGNLRASRQYSYNSAGRLVNQSCYDAEGRIQKTTINEYDANNHITRSTLYMAEKNSVTITEYNLICGIEYVVRVEKYESGTLQQLCINEYDPQGVRSRSMVSENDVFKETLYNHDGQIQEYIEYESSNQQILQHEVYAD